ncbi:MAG: hypothetical protein DWQ05_20060 [Calditrichaeota bacterium]|nr:MAG: hypothetical protein DWQ05_20060 [Calditrichota bacterium]
MTFQNTVIKKFWPAEDKNPDGDFIPQLHLQCEVELDNSLQVGFLFTSMVKGLMQINFTHEDTGESIALEAATLKPFNVKQKKMRIGKGDDAATIMAEFAQLKVITLLDEEGKLMQELYPFFNRTLLMEVDDLPSMKFGSSDAAKDEDDSPQEEKTAEVGGGEFLPLSDEEGEKE